MKYNLLTRLIIFFIFSLFGFLKWGSPSVKSNPIEGFSFDCDNTPSNPCRTLEATYQGKKIMIEPSSVAWSNRYNKAIVVSDNYNDLVTQNAGHYAIVSFSLETEKSTIAVEPLLTPQQVADYPLYDLEGVTLVEDRLYAIGSLALHGKNPKRDRWERHQFVNMELTELNGVREHLKFAKILIMDIYSRIIFANKCPYRIRGSNHWMEETIDLDELPVNDP